MQNRHQKCAETAYRERFAIIRPLTANEMMRQGLQLQSIA